MASKAGTELVGHSGNDEIGTPQWLFDDLDRRFKFTLDAAASLDNYKIGHAGAAYVATAYGTYWLNPPADARLLTEETGLQISWDGKRVFCNPPYSKPLMGQFIRKAVLERNNAEVIVLLVKYDPSTENGRLLREHFHLEYLPRVRYEGMTAAATFASVIAIAKPDFIRPKGG